MHHLLKSLYQPRFNHSLYHPLNESTKPGKPEPAIEWEPEQGAAQESKPQREPEAKRETTEPEPIYTIIGEPVIPTEESDVTTIFIDLHPVPSDEQQGEKMSEPEPDGWPLSSTMRRHLAPLGWSLIGMALVLASVLAVMLVLPWWEPSATVTIVPLTQAVSTTFTAQLVPTNVDLARQQIQGRELATLTMSQSKTAPTTGSGSQPAQAAQGWITLYNSFPTAQTIPAGTLLIGQDGVQVTTDNTVTIPAGNAPIEGSVSVSAHATEPGPTGNIAALDINGLCCRVDVLARNPSPFTRGQNARSFQAVSAQDINGTATTLETSLTQDATAAEQTQLQDGESLITPVACNPQVNTDHPQGSEAEHVTVSVSETCQGIAYNAAQMQNLVCQALNQHTQESQAGGYQLDRRSLHLQITPSSTHPGSIQVQASGILFYHWNGQQQRALAILIAGKSKTQATALLARQPGISTTAIQFNGRDTGTLPTDPSRIHFVFVTYGQ